MLDNATLDGLHTLRLPGMARGLAEQREHPDYDNLGFEERLGMLVDRELTERHNRRLERMVKAAHLRVAATVEGIDFRRPRGLDRSHVLSLAESHWVASHHSLRMSRVPWNFGGGPVMLRRLRAHLRMGV